MKIYLCTFANKSYYGSSESLIKNSLLSGIFDEVRSYNDLDLKNDVIFWSKNGSFIESNIRGYGYWLWKPYIVMKTLSEMENGDILVYCDAGCTFNGDGIPKMRFYIDQVREGASGLFGFAMEYNVEKKWTKMDLFDFLSCKHLGHTPQIMATAFLMRKSTTTTQFSAKWYNVATINNYTLLDDTPSVLSNDASFKEHRHDQSIFSLLFKLHQGQYIGDDPERHIEKNPIWATRIKKTGLMPNLNELGTQYGTDKVSHGFCKVYDDSFRAKRFLIKNFLEIGVFFGSSLLMWREFFPNAVITGMDHFTGRQGNGTVFPNADAFWQQHLFKKHARIELTKTDQSVRAELESFFCECQKSKIQYDIILDDGSHLMKDQQQTMAILFPLISEGGYFIMEDLHTSRQSGYDVAEDKSNSTLLMLEKIKSGNKCDSIYMTQTEMNYISTHIANVEFFYTNNGHSVTSIITKK